MGFKLAEAYVEQVLAECARTSRLRDVGRDLHGHAIYRVVTPDEYRCPACGAGWDGCAVIIRTLVKMPDAVRDYVMLHELMHLKRMDHSPKFWKLVEKVCPDFQASRLYLRTQHLAPFLISSTAAAPCMPVRR